MASKAQAARGRDRAMVRRLAGAALLLAGFAVAVAGNRAAAMMAVLCAAIGMALMALERLPGETVPVAPAQTPAAEPQRPGLEDLLGAVDDPLLLVEGRQVVRANAAALTLLGHHVVGEDVRLAIRHPAAAELLARGEKGEVELVGLGAHDRHWTLTIHRLGPATQLLRLTDHTATRATERIRVDFVANASHELRTPLASLIGFIETLEDANGPEDAAVRQRFLGIMAGEARRMQRLVDDLISLSRIEAEKYRPPPDAVSLGALAREAVDALGGDEQRRARLRIAVEDKLPPVAGDRAQLSQLIHNLIGNALKYGDHAKPVRVAVGRRSGMVMLSVADEGEGIAPEHLPRLTERFYRVDPGRSRAGGGTGLGLAIVKHIVERHRGRLDIASTVGVGTTVSVLLPAMATAKAVTAAPADEARQVTG